MKKQLALITGASKGIGLELAKCFARDNYDLVLVARSSDELAEAAHSIAAVNEQATSHIVATDLSKPKEACREIDDAIKKLSQPVDVLVNNAGFGLKCSFAQADMETQMDILEVNMVALTRLSRMYLPGMLERQRGGILNVASVAGFFPGPMMSVYYATKAYVISLSEALANEVAGSGVVISCTCPGPTYTHFQKRADVDGSKLFKLSPVQSAAAVADEGYCGFKRGRTIVITGVANKFAVTTGKLVPRGLMSNITRAMAEH